jgi:hypothetical protein
MRAAALASRSSEGLGRNSCLKFRQPVHEHGAGYRMRLLGYNCKRWNVEDIDHRTCMRCNSTRISMKRELQNNYQHNTKYGKHKTEVTQKHAPFSTSPLVCTK